ncbi:MAG TPA: DUF5132 domain-containing protein [Nitrospira sp.]|nr:DUF5132 domain-containing protein [Nitrospira sp.]
MAIFEDLSKEPVALLLGLGVAMAAPNIFPALASGLRPLAKALVKGGLTLYDAAREGLAEAGEQLSDLVAETRAEMGQDSKHSANGSEEDVVATPGRPRRRRTRS